MQSREALARHIDSEVQRLISDEQTKSRDPVGITLALAFAVCAYLVAVHLADENGLWWVAVVVLALFAVVGLSQEAIPRERDERGRAIRQRRRGPSPTK